MSGSRIGPHGEVYVNEGTKEQTFRQVADYIPLDKWVTPADGARHVAALLRQLADSIDKNADHLRTDPGTPPWSHEPSVPITTPLCHITLHGSVEEPPRHGRFGEDYIYNSYRLSLTARLGFE